MLYKFFFSYFCILFFTFHCISQDFYNNRSFDFDSNSKYDSNILSPEDFFGYAIGSEFTSNLAVESYLTMLSERSERVTIKQYGESYEGRKLLVLVITSANNQQNIESIRQSNLQLANPVNLSKNEIDQLSKDLPVFVSFSYNIHGNEASGTEAAMQVAYHLAAAMDEEVQTLIDQSVIIMYPTINPDGRDRYVNWYNSVKRNVQAYEPRDVEHYEPWPGGRTNHYWFDLNRDWIWCVHPESRGQTTEYLRWMPHLHTDYHEMGYNSNYFTMPGTTPRNKLLPDNYEALTDTIGRANAKFFDENQLNYYTRQSFDFFYPSYGSSYPSVMGAIGMLTEQGGSGGGGLAVETNDGYILSLRQRVFDHYQTSLATIRKAVERRSMFIDYFVEAHIPENSKSRNKAYVIPPQDNFYVNDVLKILLHHGVEVRKSKNSFSGSFLDYRNGKLASKRFDKGAIIIDANQSKHLFIHSLFERNLAIEDSVMYDMSTWAAPLAYNLDAYSTTQTIKVDSEIINAVSASGGKVENPGAQYAYVIPWDQRNSPKALAMLWKKDYRVRSAREGFSSKNQTFEPGALIILKGRNKERSDIDADMKEIASSAGVQIVGLNSGRMSKGWDLASNDSRVIKKPKVALMIESPFSTYTCGQIYFLFDQETLLPVERIRSKHLKQTAIPKFGSRYGIADLRDYDVLILPGGGSNLKKLFGEDQQKELKSWIEAGGVLIATESAVDFLTKENSKISGVELLQVKKDSTDQANYLRYEDRSDYYGKKRVPGAALNAIIDISNPLAFGLQKELYSLKFNANCLKPNPGLQTVGHYFKDADQLLVSGYASTENLNHLAGNTFAAVQPMGSGKIVYLLDNAHYRMFWRGPSRMMQNAVMLLPGM